MEKQTKRSPAADTRERLLDAAALLSHGGREAVSTRAVSAGAGVQAPTIYRLFGDMNGLLDAVATHGFRTYLADKHSLGDTDDPVDDLRRGWDLHIEFGLSMSAFYALMYGEGRERASPAGREAYRMLRRQIGRVGAAGGLRMSVDRATLIMHASGVGVVLSLLATPPPTGTPGSHPSSANRCCARSRPDTRTSPPPRPTCPADP
ncbi:TetR/AcrR family transcriptional regulator [Streptomyces sp. NPDC048231]|uniref:TetR/AcrR family transcriptional regulator n=1 Tax=Streptomyces sp. NPDC048231 TaxID=3365519 RepID=UPI003720E9F8